MSTFAFNGWELPIVQADNFDVGATFQDSYSQPNQQIGVISGSGTDPFFLGEGEIDMVLSITPSWCAANGYTNANDYANVQTALVDFSDKVLKAGEKSLVYTLPPGSTHGVGGASITTATYTCRASKSYKVSRGKNAEGAPTADISLTLILTSPVVSFDDGTTTYVV